MINPDNTGNVRIPSRKDDDRDRSDPVRRPISPSRDFKKMMDEGDHRHAPPTTRKTGKDKKNDEVVDPAAEETDETEEDEGVPPSLLTLASKKAPSKGEVTQNPNSAFKTIEGRSQQPKEKEEDPSLGSNSPWALYQQTAGKKAQKPFASETMATTEEEPPRPIRKSSQKEGTASSRFKQDQSDLSAVNPLASPVNALAGVSDSSGQVSASRITQLQEIVNQMVDKMHTMQREGKTETIVVLKMPPNSLFEGARVIVSSFDSATKEFNIAFENLRPDAKRLLDLNQNALRMDLETKGYANAVHIITTTTLIERPVPSDAGQSFARGNRDGNQGDNKERQQKDKEQG